MAIEIPLSILLPKCVVQVYRRYKYHIRTIFDFLSRNLFIPFYSLPWGYITHTDPRPTFHISFAPVPASALTTRPRRWPRRPQSPWQPPQAKVPLLPATTSASVGAGASPRSLLQGNRLTSAGPVTPALLLLPVAACRPSLHGRGKGLRAPCCQ